jgi:hypothetical protein
MEGHGEKVLTPGYLLVNNPQRGGLDAMRGTGRGGGARSLVAHSFYVTPSKKYDLRRAIPGNSG